MWHRLVRWIGKRNLRWFYRDVLVIGGERIPAQGPVVLVANHPNDLPDVLMGYLSTPRTVRFVATISAATSPLARATYRGLGVVPVTRIRDARRLLQQGADISEVNRTAYRQVAAALQAGELIALFPEGGVQYGTNLASFRSGAAQMVLQCLDDAECAALTVVPVGFQYEGRDAPASDCGAIIGTPMRIASSDFADPRSRVRELTGVMRGGVAELIRFAPDESAASQVDLITAVVGASLAAHPQDGFPAAASVAPLISRLHLEEPASATLNDMVEASDCLGELLQRIGGEPRSARDHSELRFAAERGEHAADKGRARFSGLQSGRTPWLIATAPLALLGWLVHGPVLALVWRLAKRIAEDRAHRVARAFLPGIYIVLLWYVVVSGLAAFGLSLLGRSPWYALLLFMLLFRLGDVAAEWRHGFALLRLRQRARRLPDATLDEVRTLHERVRKAWAGLGPVEGAGRAASVRVIA